MEGVKKLLVVLLYAALITEEVVLATDHVVGGSSGWDESTDFSSWASGETFKVGDKLVFKYSTMHSVVELGNESAYKSCDIGSAVDSMKGGNSVVKLDKAGTRYFACGTMGHCGQGMKVNITTVSANAGGPTSTTTSSSSSSSSSSSPTGSTSTTPSSHSSSTPTSTSAASNFHHFVSFISLATLMIFALLFTIV